MSSWYLTGKAGRRYLWNKDVTFVCPHAATVQELDDDALGAYVEAAKLLGVDGHRLHTIVRNAHRHGTRRQRVAGKLTDRCDHCGAKLNRLGFRAWIEEPVPKHEQTDAHRLSASLNAALGSSDATPRRTVRSTWHKTKSEAEKWARHEKDRSA